MERAGIVTLKVGFPCCMCSAGAARALVISARSNSPTRPSRELSCHPGSKGIERTVLESSVAFSPTTRNYTSADSPAAAGAFNT